MFPREIIVMNPGTPSLSLQLNTIELQLSLQTTKEFLSSRGVRNE